MIMIMKNYPQCVIPSTRLRNPSAQQVKLEMARQKRISYFNEILLKLFFYKAGLKPHKYVYQ